jgi:polyadenylate-binding protein
MTTNSAIESAPIPSAPVSEAVAASQETGYAPEASQTAPAQPFAGYPAPVTPAVPFSGVAASLYVGELHPEVNEAILFEHFSQIGPVASIRVCRDAITRRSLGYAYVNFHNALDAERAMESFNYMPIRGKPCRIMWSQRDPSLRKSGSGNIFIKNLDKSVDNKALHDTFNSFGKVLSCKVVCDPQGQSKGFAFVHFEGQEAADKAIARVNGKMLNGKIVYVGPYQSRKERLPRIEEAKNNFTNVFIKNIDTSLTDDDFLKLVEPFGGITSATLQKDTQGTSRGFGFVNYQTHESAEAAITALNGKEVKGKELFASRAQLKTERVEELRKAYEKMREEKLAKYTNLYVKNLDDQIDEEALKAKFLPYGPINSTVIMRDEKGISKGFGFVSYEASADAAQALSELNGKILGSKPLYVALAQRKEERRMQLEAQYAQRMMKQYAAPMFYPGAGAAMSAGVPTTGNRMPAGPTATYVPGMPPTPMGMAHRQRMIPGAASGAYPSQIIMPSGPGQHRGNRRQDGNGPNRSAGGFHHGNGNASFRRNGGASSPAASGKRSEHFHQQQQQQQSSSGLNATLLAAASPEEQKQMLGERLFPLVRAREPELAGKITGMLIEMDNGEILHLLESPDSLAAKVDEALEVIRYHTSVKA